MNTELTLPPFLAESDYKTHNLSKLITDMPKDYPRAYRLPRATHRYNWPRDNTRRVFSPAWRMRWEARKLLRKAQNWVLRQMGDISPLGVLFTVVLIGGLGALITARWVG